MVLWCLFQSYLDFGISQPWTIIRAPRKYTLFTTLCDCYLKRVAIVNSLISAVCYIIVAYFLHNFDLVHFDVQERKAFSQDLDSLAISLNYFWGVCVVYFLVNFVLVLHQLEWQGMLDKSWCSMNYFAREERERESIK